jgi:hypothetical protein
MIWKCECCGLVFNSKKRCDLHEGKCKKESEKKHQENIRKNVLVSKWILFGIMILFALILFSTRWFFSVLSLLISLFFFPIGEKFLDKKYKFSLNIVLKYLGVVLFFVLLIWTAPFCGDNSCNGNEDSILCVNDCGSICGDGICNGEETRCNCVEDCGECVTKDVCGSATCEEDICVWEIKDNCCGNDFAELGETCSSCSQDVKCLNGDVCFNQECVKLDWSCSDWSSCSKGGLQMRSCVESNGLVEGKPVEEQSCEYILENFSTLNLLEELIEIIQSADGEVGEVLTIGDKLDKCTELCAGEDIVIPYVKSTCYSTCYQIYYYAGEESLDNYILELKND